MKKWSDWAAQRLISMRLENEANVRELSSLRRAVEILRQAVVDEGVNPEFHRKVMRKHRAEWPALWSAIDGVLGGGGEWDGNVLLSRQSADDLLERIAYLEKQCLHWKGNCADIATSSREVTKDLIEKRKTIEDIAAGLYDHLSRHVCHCNMSKCKCGHDDLLEMYTDYVEGRYADYAEGNFSQNER